MSDDGVITILPTNLNIRQPLGNDEFLLVGPFLHIDDFMVFHEGTAYLDSVGDVAELSRTVTSNHESVRVVVVIGCLCRCHRQQGKD